MLNSVQLVRNVSQRFARNPSLVRRTNETINRTASRQLKSLSNTNKPVNQGKQNRQWSQIQSTNLGCNFYSTEPTDEDEPSATVRRKLPKLNNDKIAIGPPFFAFFKFTWKALQIRNTYDADFSLNEFVEGSKKAVEIVSDKLANGDFDGLRGLVTDNTIDALRDVITSWTEEQRSELRVLPDDICRLYVSEIEIEEDADSGSGIVNIFMIYHVVKDFKELTTEPKITPSLKASELMKKTSEFLDDNFFILNYKFTKEFSKDSNDDWIVSYINHVNISDEMREQTKEIEEMMKKKFNDYEQEKRKKK